MSDPTGENRPFRRTPGGLWIPRDVVDVVVAADWSTASSGLVLPDSGGPTMLDQVAIIADESSVGLPSSSIDDVRALVARVPFKPALTLAARFAQRLWPIRNRPEAHGEMAREVYGDSPVVERLLEVQRLASGEAPVYLFSEQQLLSLPGSSSSRRLTNSMRRGRVQQPIGDNPTAAVKQLRE